MHPGQGSDTYYRKKMKTALSALFHTPVVLYGKPRKIIQSQNWKHWVWLLLSNNFIHIFMEILLLCEQTIKRYNTFIKIKTRKVVWWDGFWNSWIMIIKLNINQELIMKLQMLFLDFQTSQNQQKLSQKYLLTHTLWPLQWNVLKIRMKYY